MEPWKVQWSFEHQIDKEFFETLLRYLRYKSLSPELKRKFIADKREAMIWLEEQLSRYVTETDNEAEKETDDLISVDRSVPIAYPQGMTPVHPEMAHLGPTQYHLRFIWKFLTDDQAQRTYFPSGTTSGERVYRELKDHNRLIHSLSLADAVEIQKRGVDLFRKCFSGQAPFFWKSVAKKDGVLMVPCLMEGGAGLVIYWKSLDEKWTSQSPALVDRGLTS